MKKFARRSRRRRTTTSTRGSCSTSCAGPSPGTPPRSGPAFFPFWRALLLGATLAGLICFCRFTLPAPPASMTFLRNSGGNSRGGRSGTTIEKMRLQTRLKKVAGIHLLVLEMHGKMDEMVEWMVPMSTDRSGRSTSSETKGLRGAATDPSVCNLGQPRSRLQRHRRGHARSARVAGPPAARRAASTVGGGATVWSRPMQSLKLHSSFRNETRV